MSFRTMHKSITYFVCLFLHKVRNPKSFEIMKTMNGVLRPTFQFIPNIGDGEYSGLSTAVFRRLDYEHIS